MNTNADRLAENIPAMPYASSIPVYRTPKAPEGSTKKSKPAGEFLWPLDAPQGE